MKKRKQVIIISLGGSLIIPDKINTKLLLKFKKIIKKNSNKYKFIIVCGGGSIARKYISALRTAGINEKFQSLSGISATRMNARFMSYLFNIDAERGIPHSTKNVKKSLKKQDIVFCGGLQYKPQQTSDSSAAELAAYFRTEFINLTNVSGLHDKNPLKYKNAKFIPKITWNDFYKMANKQKYSPGQHFILDQTAAKIIMNKKITTYILGKDFSQLDRLLKGKKFKGTIIKG